MQYDVIVLGATFTAAGLLQVYKDKCLVLERRPQAGYEFFNAINFGTDYNKQLQTDAAKALREKFIEKKAFNGERICLFDCAAPFYSLLKGKNVMLNMELVSIIPTPDRFSVTVHGVSGYRTYSAKTIIDTRVHQNMIAEKTLNLLVSSENCDLLDLPSSFKLEKWGYTTDVLIKCPVDVKANYLDARKAVADVIRILPEGCKAALVADMFDCRLKGSYPYKKDGITYIPSSSYSNPLLAFDAGVIYALRGEL